MSKVEGTLSKIGFDNRGYCLVSPDESWVYIPITKNASSFTEYILKHKCDWRESNFIAESKLTEKKILVVLRDPLDRWMTGVVEHFDRKNSINSGVRLDNEHLLYYVFNQGALDEHSELQVNFLKGIEMGNCTFIKLEDNYTNLFQSFLKQNLVQKFSLWNRDYSSQYNDSASRPVKRVLLSYIKKYYNDNMKAQNNINIYLKPDVDFMSGLEFYNETRV